MENSIHTTVRPLAICCSLLGFYTGGVRGKTCEWFVVIYCWLVTVLFLTNRAVLTLMRIPTMPYSFVHVTYELAQIVHIAMLTYYRIKFMTRKNVFSDIYRNIDCANVSIERVGVKVAYKREKLECVMYVALIIAVHSMHLLSIILNGNHSFDILNTVYSNRYHLVKFLLSFSRRILLAHVVFILHVIKKRLSLFEKAILKNESCFERKIVWATEISIKTVHYPFATTSFTETEHYCKEFHKISKYIDDAFSKIKKFYALFLCFHVLLAILGTSVTLYFSVITKDCRYFIHFTGWNALLCIMPAAVCMDIQYKFEIIQNLMNKLYWINDRRTEPEISRTKILLLRTMHVDKKFDCRYFSVDINVLSIFVQFITLLIFAMLT